MAIIAKLYTHPASADYKDLIYTDTMTKNAFLNLGTLKNTLNCNRPIQQGRLDIPMNLGDFQNSDINMISYKIDNGREEIYFVVGSRWINNNTTRLTLKKNVFYTYLGEWSIPSCTVEREHQPMWSDNQPIFSTTPEPIEGSGELRILQESIVSSNIDWACVVVSPTDGLEIEGDATVNNPFVFYIPIAEKTFDLTFINGNFNLSTSGSLRGHPYIQNIYAVPFVPFTYTKTPNPGNPNQIQLNITGGTNTTISYTGSEGERAPDINCIFAENIFSKNLATIDLSSGNYPINIPANWQASEPKIYTSLYRKIRLVSPGGEAEIAMENLSNYRQIQVKGFAAYGANPTVKYQIVGYNGIGGSLCNLIDDNEDRTLPIVNDTWNDYVARNANSMNFTMFQRIFSSLSNMPTLGMKTITNSFPSGTGTQTFEWEETVPTVGGGNPFLSQAMSGLADLDKWTDINHMPNTISNTNTSGTFESYFKSGGNVYIQVLGFKDSEYSRIASFLHRWGYTAGGRVGSPNLATRTDFDFKKMTALSVQGIQNMDDEEEFKQIFLSGTTLWHRPNPYDANKWFSPAGPNN